MYDEIIKEQNVIAWNNDVNYFAIWGTEGGNNWIWSKQEEDKEFKIQVFISDQFDTYKKIKDEIVLLFSQLKCSLVDEEKIEQKFGCRRNLFFMDTNKYNIRKAEQEKVNDLVRKPSANTHIDTVNNQRGNFVIGDAIDSTLNIDNSVKEIYKLIEQRGGEDKAELRIILSEAKVVAEEIKTTGYIALKESFGKNLSNHLSKHGWFYGAILTYLGAVVIWVHSKS